jgi:NTP pyrophosphatase (non-canonical NTP hydrolase)
MNFDEYQKQAKRTEFFAINSDNSERDLRRLYLISGLISQVGEIANRLKKKLRDGQDYILLKAEVEERLGHALWYIASLASEFGVSLSEIADQNTGFNNRRWSQVQEPPQLLHSNDFDGDYPPEQRLPRRLAAHFRTVETGGLKKTVVEIFPNWPDRAGAMQFGDPIDDNSWDDDHYRYHDVFHFAYLAVLWWSPVVRKLLLRKRKDKENPDVDRIEDGARAVDTEEATTAFIYSYVSQQQFLATSTNIDTGLLTTIRTLLRGFEVRACTEKEWESAIINAAEVLRQLVENGGGWVEANRDERRIKYLGLNVD